MSPSTQSPATQTIEHAASYAVFPLHTVLFPGCKIELRIFEQRYLRLVSESTQQDKPFVISLIQGQSSEVGVASECHEIACLARIIDFNQRQTGVLDIVARAGSRVRILNTKHEADNLLRAELEAFTESEVMDMPPHHHALLKVLAAIKNNHPHLFDEKIENLSASEISFYLSHIAPVSSSKKQKLLALQNTAERLDHLQTIFSNTRFTLTA